MTLILVGAKDSRSKWKTRRNENKKHQNFEHVAGGVQPKTKSTSKKQHDKKKERNRLNSEEVDCKSRHGGRTYIAE